MDVQRQVGRYRQRRRTRQAILNAAVALVREGKRPSVAEAAEAADISRRVGYRYFPTQEQLLTEATLEALRVEAEAEMHAEVLGRSVEERVEALISWIWRSTSQNEALLRSMIRLTVEQPAGDEGLVGDAGSSQPRRGYRRIDWIEQALEPLRDRLDEMEYQRLVSALALVMGIEALLVLRDIRGLDLHEAEAVSQWMARCLIACAVDEPAAPTSRPT